MKNSRRKTHYTITEAAEKLGITRAAVHDAIKKKRLPAKRGKIEITQIQVKEAWLIPKKALDGYPYQRKKTPKD
ncbi:MAG: helix-turn-helix domain-containing protein [Deltaproteobacteria bacterium]|nr:helix-turn-helix domain-containing protein [Deltaproteobacteria bacterium]